MFTGIVTNVGTLKNVFTNENQVYLEIESSIDYLESNIVLGSSIAVDGVCLTVTGLQLNSFTVQAMPETLKLTNLKTKKIGDELNLEPALKLNQSLDGHLVQGHVDGTGKVVFNGKKSDGNWILQIEPPTELLKFIAYKGSITINGVSLTVSVQTGNTFEVSLIEYTLNHTNLKYLFESDLVNLEVDVIARYLEKLINNTNYNSRI